MKLWKAPIFYIGIALVMAIGLALAAPYLIDWGSYRPTIEAYGQKLTGRKVAVAGDISGRLFPWPKLTLHDVRIANPAGTKNADFIKADTVDVRMTLAGLFAGEVRVETIDVSGPEISFERMANGKGSWMFEPKIDVAANPALERIRLDQISLKGGTVHLIDSRRRGTATFTDVNGTLAAQSLAGPWRVRAQAAYRGVPIDVGINTGSWQKDQPFKFGFRIAPREGAGLVYQFDGQNDGQAVSGGLRIEPASDAKGKDDTEGRLRPLALTAKLTAGFDAISFEKIEIAPRDSVGGTNLLSGSARITLGPMIGLTADLAATRFDLDAVAGNKARQMLREGGGLELLDGVVAGLPPNIDIQATLKVTALVMGGETVDNAKLQVGLSNDAIRIRELSASLPGQARALFEGIFLPTDAGPQLSGNFAGEAGNLRDFVEWAWPEGKADIERVWTGARGRLKLEARVDAVSGQLRLQDVNYQLGDSSGTGGLALSFGDRLSADIRIDANRIDIDSYLPRGVKGGGWIEVASLIPQWAKENDLRLTIQSAEALINGVNARDVAIDVAAEKGAIDLKMIEIGNVGNARLETIGLISPAETGIEGSLSTSVIAENPQGLLRLFGMIPPDADPLWTRALGKTDLRIAADFASDAGGQTAKYKIAGKSGLLAIDAAFDAAGSLSPTDSEFSGGATITSDTSAALLALAGFAPAMADTQPAALRFTATGSLNAGLVAEAEASVLGAKGQFQGKLSRSEGVLTGSGRAGMLSERPETILTALGIAGVEAAKTLSFESDVALTPAGLSLTALNGFAGASPISGTITIDSERRLKGDLATGPLALDRLLKLTFLPWSGREPTVEDAFALTLPGGITGELWLRPSSLTVYDGLSIPESQIGISATTGERRIVALGRAGSSGDVNIEVGGKNTIAGFDMDAHAVLPVDLGEIARFTTGGRAATGLVKVKLDGKASGRTPAAVLAAFNGTLSYDVAGLAVAGIDTDSFVDKAREAKSAEDLKAALVALTAQGEVAFGNASGAVAIDKGVASLPALSAEEASARITFTPKIDFGAGRLDANAHIEWRGLGDVPASDIAFGGPPTGLTRFADTAALESALGFRIFESGLKELERVQAEQKRLLEEEERQRKEDEERLADYLAQRRENQLRLRELRVHRVVREQEAAQRKAEIEQAIKEGARMNRAELRNRLRERTVHRALQRIEREKAEALAKAEAERIEQERLQALKDEQARIEAEKKAEQERLQALKDEQARIEAEKAEQERLQALKDGQARVEAEKAEQMQLQEKAAEAAAAVSATIAPEAKAGVAEEGAATIDTTTEIIAPAPPPKPKSKPKTQRKPKTQIEDKTSGEPVVLVPPQKRTEKKRYIIDYLFGGE